MITINYDVFRGDAGEFKEWAKTTDTCLPGGFGIDKDWLPDDGLAPASNVNGPPDDMLLMTYPGTDPWRPSIFFHIPGFDAYFLGYIDACRREYEFIADGAIAMSLLSSLLLRTMEAYAEQESMAAAELERLRKEVEQL
jgi:hypothetical protein